jgi:hypothetical protein
VSEGFKLLRLSKKALEISEIMAALTKPPDLWRFIFWCSELHCIDDHCHDLPLILYAFYPNN